MSGLVIALGGIVLASTVSSVLAAPQSAAMLRRSRSPLRHPGVWLLAITALIYLNQVLFTIYVIRVHHGDPTFIAQYLPEGWFALAEAGPLIGFLAEHWPFPELLSVSVLRVQAFLELPFVVLAYLLVCRWFGADLYRRAVRLVWAVSASYTATFCLIEWSLVNPYTIEDIVIRVVAAVVLPLVTPQLAEPETSPVTSARDLLVFVVSAAMLGQLVLACYDTALLYNLGHLSSQLPVILISGVVLIATRLVARRVRAQQAGPGVDMVSTSFGWFLALFFVPALSIRYGLGFGVPILAAVSATAISIAALVYGAGETFPRARVSRSRWLAETSTAAGVGIVSGAAGYLLASGYPEARILIAATAFVVLATVICALIDSRFHERVQKPNPGTESEVPVSPWVG